MKAAKKTIGLKSHLPSPSICWGKKMMHQTASMLIAPADIEMPKVMVAAEESEEVDTDSSTSSLSRELHSDINLSPGGRLWSLTWERRKPGLALQ